MINELNYKEMDSRELGEELLKAMMGLSVKFAQERDFKSLSFSDVEDSAMEAVGRAWKSLDSFDASKGKLSTWLGTIAYNTLATTIKKNEKWSGLFESNAIAKVGKDEDGKEVVEWFDAHDAVANDSTDDFAICNEIRKKACSIIERRPERDATIIRMNMEGIGANETAKVFGITPNAVSVSLNRTRKELMKEIPRPVCRKKKEYREAV